MENKRTKLERRGRRLATIKGTTRQQQEVAVEKHAMDVLDFCGGTLNKTKQKQYFKMAGLPPEIELAARIKAEQFLEDAKHGNY